MIDEIPLDPLYAHATAYTRNAQIYTTILIMLKTSSSLSRINRLAKNKI